MRCFWALGVRFGVSRELSPDGGECARWARRPCPGRRRKVLLSGLEARETRLRALCRRAPLARRRMSCLSLVSPGFPPTTLHLDLVKHAATMLPCRAAEVAKKMLEQRSHNCSPRRTGHGAEFRQMLETCSLRYCWSDFWVPDAKLDQNWIDVDSV